MVRDTCLVERLALAVVKQTLRAPHRAALLTLLCQECINALVRSQYAGLLPSILGCDTAFAANVSPISRRILHFAADTGHRVIAIGVSHSLRQCVYLF